MFSKRLVMAMQRYAIEAIYYFGEESPEIFKESGTCKRPAVSIKLLY